jgi:hypothetical protein
MADSRKTPRPEDKGKITSKKGDIPQEPAMKKQKTASKEQIIQKIEKLSAAVQKLINEGKPFRSAERRLTRIVTDFNRNNQERLNSNSWIFSKTSKQKIRSALRKADVSTVTAKNMRLKIVLRKPAISKRPFKPMQPHEKMQASKSYLGALNKEVRVDPPGWLVLGGGPNDITVNVFVGNQAVSFIVSRYMSMKMFNELIASRLNQPAESFYLSRSKWGGVHKSYVDGLTLDDAGLLDSSDVHVFFRLVGGMINEDDDGGIMLSKAKGVWKEKAKSKDAPKPLQPLSQDEQLWIAGKATEMETDYLLALELLEETVDVKPKKAVEIVSPPKVPSSNVPRHQKAPEAKDKPVEAPEIMEPSKKSEKKRIVEVHKNKKGPNCGINAKKEQKRQLEVARAEKSKDPKGPRLCFKCDTKHLPPFGANCQNQKKPKAVCYVCGMTFSEHPGKKWCSKEDVVIDIDDLAGHNVDDVLDILEVGDDGNHSDSDSSSESDEPVNKYDDLLCADSVDKFEVLVGDSSYSLFPGLDNKDSLEFLRSVYPTLLAPSFHWMLFFRIFVMIVSVATTLYSFVESTWYEFIIYELLAIQVGRILAIVIDRTIVRWWIARKSRIVEDRLDLLYGVDESYRYVLTPTGPVEVLTTKAALHVGPRDAVAELKLNNVLMNPHIVGMLDKYNDFILNVTEFDRAVMKIVKYLSPAANGLIRDYPDRLLPYNERVISYTRGANFHDQSRGDGRADNVSMGDIKHNDPCYQNYIKRIGSPDSFDQQLVVISKTLVTQVISSPPIFNRNDDQQTRDSKLEMCVKNIHTINMKAHLNLDENVLVETIDFLKYYTRYKCRKQTLWSPILKGESRAL